MAYTLFQVKKQLKEIIECEYELIIDDDIKEGIDTLAHVILDKLNNPNTEYLDRELAAEEEFWDDAYNSGRCTTEGVLFDVYDETEDN